jgi:hypothetical protein
VSGVSVCAAAPLCSSSLNFSQHITQLKFWFGLENKSHLNREIKIYAVQLFLKSYLNQTNAVKVDLVYAVYRDI